MMTMNRFASAHYFWQFTLLVMFGFCGMIMPGRLCAETVVKADGLEALMCAVQEREYVGNGVYVTWPPNASGITPGNYPPAGFYQKGLTIDLLNRICLAIYSGTCGAAGAYILDPGALEGWDGTVGIPVASSKIRSLPSPVSATTYINESTRILLMLKFFMTGSSGGAYDYKKKESILSKGWIENYQNGQWIRSNDTPVDIQADTGWIPGIPLGSSSGLNQ